MKQVHGGASVTCFQKHIVRIRTTWSTCMCCQLGIGWNDRKILNFTSSWLYEKWSGGSPPEPVFGKWGEGGCHSPPLILQPHLSPFGCCHKMSQVTLGQQALVFPSSGDRNPWVEMLACGGEGQGCCAGPVCKDWPTYQRPIFRTSCPLKGPVS